MSITDWPADERPRERLLEKGAQSLSDAELLAIFLRTGIVGKSAVDLARELISHFGNLTRLFAASQSEFTNINGMGNAKYAQLQAVLEMAKRALNEALSEGDLLSSPEKARQFLCLQLAHLPCEVFFALWTDTQNRLIKSEELFRGTLSQSNVYPREIVKKALAHNAHGVIFAHNHPSGKTTPSENDKKLTENLQQTLALIDVKVLDHFIIAGTEKPFSFAENHLL